MVACQRCGEQNPGHARFCLGCGSALEGEAAPAREERKVVTVLFVDLVGFTSRAERLDPEDVRALLHPYWERVRVELQRRGGTVEKFIGDAVMALFGAPVAHEDDPERAVRSAFAIQNAIGELNDEQGLQLSVRIAVATGEAVIDLRARPEAGHGMAAGDILNTGFRLAEAAPVDGILVDESTYRATQDAIEFRAADPVHAKGKADPLLVWEAIAPRARFGEDDVLRPLVPLVNRHDELTQLLDAFERTRTRRAAHLANVVGVPGIGKSRLVLEVASELDGRPELVFWRQGRSLPYGEETPFWALAEIVKAHAGIVRTDDPAATERKLRRALGQALPEAADAAWVEGHMRPLVGLPRDENGSGDRRREEFAAWRRFFEGLARQSPLVLVFEDIHWADEGLLEFIDHLAAWVTDVPLLIVCTARAAIFERHPRWGRGHAGSVLVSLGPLGDEETATLMGKVLGDAALPSQVADHVLARADGNPLYAQEYARMLVDRGILRREHEGAQLELQQELPVPESVQGVIAGRIDTLPPEEKELLQAASVLGRNFWLGALAVLTGLPHYVVDERLASLERKEFLRRELRSPVAGEDQYAFHHVLVRDIAYSQMPRAVRAEKHGRAAEWLDTLKSDRADLAETVAHHYERALAFARAAGTDTPELADRARVALRAAADRAMALNGWSSARRLYEEALALWPPGAERARLLVQCGKAALRADGVGAELFEEALESLEPSDRELAAEAVIALGELAFRQGDRDGAFGRFEAARALVAGTDDTASKAWVLSTLSRFHSIALEPEPAIETGREALDLAERLGLPEVRAHALNNIGWARVALGDRGGLDDLEQSLAVAVERSSPEIVRASLNLGTALAHFGDLGGTFAVHAEGRRAAERFGDPAGMQWFAAERLWELYWRGSWDEALTLADALLAEVEAGSPRSYSEPAARLARGWIELARGRSEEALADVTVLCDFARDAKYLQIMLPALALRARVLAAADREDKAWQDVDELLRLWEESGIGIGAYWTADLAFAVNRLGRADALVAPLATVPETPWVQAARSVCDGSFAEAAGLYAQIGTLPDEALARLYEAERLVEAGDRDAAARELGIALAFYRRAGADRYVGESEALLAVTSS
jgi:class 3 adenylate cyclase/tetratricopeptide (TPR) repeat protein